MLSNVLTYLVLKDNIMRAKHYEKILSKRRKQYEIEQDKIENLDISQPQYIYMDANGTIDWDRLAKHVSEATSGRQQS